MPPPWGGRWVLTRASVCGPRGQGAPVEAFLTALTVGTCRVVQATQAVARQGVTVAHGVGVHVPTALAPPAGLGSPREPQRVPKVAIITDLTAPPWGREKAVCGGGSPRHAAAGSPSGEGGCPSGLPVQQSMGSGARAQLSHQLAVWSGAKPLCFSELGLLVGKVGTMMATTAEGLSPPSSAPRPPSSSSARPAGYCMVKAGAGANPGPLPRGLLPPRTAAPCSPKILPQAHLSLGQTQLLKLSTPTEGAPLMSTDLGGARKCGGSLGNGGTA